MGNSTSCEMGPVRNLSPEWGSLSDNDNKNRDPSIPTCREDIKINGLSSVLLSPAFSRPLFRPLSLLVPVYLRWTISGGY